MNYLITGATGFIGSLVIDELLARGHSANYLARKRSSQLDGRAAFHPWNINEEPPLDSVPRLDAVIHLAGEPVAQRWTPQVKKRIFESRVLGTRNLVSAISRLKYKPSVLVSASAVGYYGARGNEVLTEESGPGRGFLSEVCVAWEREAFRAQESGVRVVAARIATVLGKDGGALKKMLPAFQLGIGGKFGDGRQWMSWIHVRDLVELLLFASETAGASGALNASSPEPVTNEVFTREMAKAVHRPAVIPVPKFALRIALGEMSGFLFDSLRVQPQATERAGFRFGYPTLAEALRNVLT
ncbi:MAG: hypothetical protein JWP08_2125 [Bryobacterales bacterium]|nr:hypothetical protein [Bryobacterales bacterium]